MWEDENFLASLDINPIKVGHVLLVPKIHINYVFDLTEPLYSQLFQAAKTLSEPLRHAINASKVGVVVEGFGVPHGHLHLVPVNGGNELNPERAAPAKPEALEKVAAQIRRHLKQQT